MKESFDFMSISAIIIIVLIIFIYCYQKNRDSDMIQYLNSKFEQSQEVIPPQQFSNPAPVPVRSRKIQSVHNQTRSLGPVKNFHQSFFNFNSNANRLGWRNVYDSKNNKDIPARNAMDYNNFKDIPTGKYLNNLESTKNLYL